MSGAKRSFAAAVTVLGVLGALLGGCAKTPPVPSGQTLRAGALSLFRVSGAWEYDTLLRFTWTEAEGAAAYQLIFQHLTEGGAAETITAQQLSYPYWTANDALAWYCQEQELGGEDITVRAVVRALDRDGAVLAEGVSGEIAVRDFFPPETPPALGTDIPWESVTSFSASGNGSWAQANYSYLFTRTERGCQASCSYIRDDGRRIEAEKDLSAEQWQSLLALLHGGTLYRAWAEDPELELLDGSSFSLTLTWEGETRAQRWYRLSLEDQDEKALFHWIHQNLA